VGDHGRAAARLRRRQPHPRDLRGLRVLPLTGPRLLGTGRSHVAGPARSSSSVAMAPKRPGTVW
jgi:hypothetical protein